jgi:hypothetical protein
MVSVYLPVEWFVCPNAAVNGFKHGSCYLDGVPQPEVIQHYEDVVFDSVRRLRDHPALAGYYGCDDVSSLSGCGSVGAVWTASMVCLDDCSTLGVQCCHTGRGTFCAKEYRGIAKIREEIFALGADSHSSHHKSSLISVYSHVFLSDPYHPTFGTSACGEVWMWQEEGFGLGLDVVMKGIQAAPKIVIQ